MAQRAEDFEKEKLQRKSAALKSQIESFGIKIQKQKEAWAYKKLCMELEEFKIERVPAGSTENSLASEAGSDIISKF